MKLQLFVDNLMSQIDTRDPDLLARWLLEQFALIDWTPATQVRAQARPSWSDFDQNGQAKADWLTDSRDVTARWGVKSPEDVLEQLTAALAEARARK